MKTIKVFGFQQTAPNQFTFTGQELEKLLNKVYSEGYEEGYLSLTTNAAHIPDWRTMGTGVPYPNQFIENKISNPTIEWAKTNLTNGDVK